MRAKTDVGKLSDLEREHFWKRRVPNISEDPNLNIGSKSSRKQKWMFGNSQLKQFKYLKLSFHYQSKGCRHPSTFRFPLLHLPTLWWTRVETLYPLVEMIKLMSNTFVLIVSGIGSWRLQVTMRDHTALRFTRDC